MTNAFMRFLVAVGAGGLFGFGLSLSGMLDPRRVRGFLDIFGDFDPTLAFVLLGAVSVSAAGYLLSRRMRGPFLDRSFHLPAQKRIDRRLIAGAAVFGIGWGMSGLCPGPAIASLAFGLVPPAVFAAAMVAGILIHDHWPAIRELVAKRFLVRQSSGKEAGGGAT